MVVNVKTIFEISNIPSTGIETSYVTTMRESSTALLTLLTYAIRSIRDLRDFFVNSLF